MAGTLKLARAAQACCLAGVLCLVMPLAHAMGPDAPFAAPSSDQVANAPSPDAAAVITQGLAGLRLGANAGAVIDGAWVPVGRQARGARLVSVRRGQAQLRHPDGRTETLELFEPPRAGAHTSTAASAPAASLQKPPK